jgi:DNA-directed RNA polymerase beta subunit
MQLSKDGLGVAILIEYNVTVHHTLTPIIVNKYGSYGSKDIETLSGWNTLALDESLTPFQNQVDSDRLTLARTHSTQVTPVSNAEAPLVCSGAEFIVGQLASPRFIHKAKKDGEVTNVDPGRTLTVKYKDNTIDVLDIIPRMSRTKRGSYIALEMNTLEVGKKFKANQAIAFTKNFDQQGTYCSGKNVKVAILNYLGLNHEDSYVISKNLAETTKTDTVEEVHIIVPPNTKIINMIKENIHVKNGDVLVEFSYNESLDNYLSSTHLDPIEDDESNTLDMYSTGTNSIKLLAPEGDIIDIKVYVNNKNTADKSLLNYHDKLIKEQKRLISKIASPIKDKSKQINATDNMNLSFMNIGNNKFKGSIFVGTRITYFIKRPKELNTGDKISNRYGRLCHLYQ